MFQIIEPTPEEAKAHYLAMDKEALIEMLMENQRIVKEFQTNRKYSGFVQRTCGNCGGKGFRNHPYPSTTSATEICKVCNGSTLEWVPFC